MKLVEDLKMQYSSGGIAQKLLFWNIGLFAIPNVFFALLSLFKINIDFLYYVSLSSNVADLLWKPWSILTYAFFHSGFLHLFFNLMVLNFTSRLFLTYFTEKQFLNLYVLGIISAGCIYLISYFIVPSLAVVNVGLIGASGAIMAVLFATASYAPFMEVRLLLIGNVKLWHIALVLVVVDLVQLPLENTGGHLAHLGGVLCGYFYIKQLQRGTDIGAWISTSFDWLTYLFVKKNLTPFKKIHRNYYPKPITTFSKIITKDKLQQQIDDILDKISKSGYDSLTKDEKEFLFKSGKE